MFLMVDFSSGEESHGSLLVGKRLVVSCLSKLGFMVSYL